MRLRSSTSSRTWPLRHAREVFKDLVRASCPGGSEGESVRVAISYQSRETNVSGDIAAYPPGLLRQPRGVTSGQNDCASIRRVDFHSSFLADRAWNSGSRSIGPHLQSGTHRAT